MVSACSMAMTGSRGYIVNLLHLHHGAMFTVAAEIILEWRNMGCNKRRMSSRDLILEFLRLQLYNDITAITKNQKETKMGKIKVTPNPPTIETIKEY